MPSSSRPRLVDLALRLVVPSLLSVPGAALAQTVAPPPVIVVEGPSPTLPPGAVVVLPAPVPPPPPPPPPPPAEFVGPAGERLDEARFTDTNSDHVILGLTAETHPKGTFYVSDYELVLPQIGYAITDSLQISLTGLPPYLKNQAYFFDVGLKLNVVRSDVFRAALAGGVDVFIDPSASSNGTVIGGHVTAVAQFCFEKTCRSSLALNGGTFLNNQSNDLLPVYGTAGLTIGVSKLVSLLAEPGIGSVIGTGSLDGQGGNAFFLDYGIRLSGEHFGVDLAFVRPFVSGTSDVFALGFPWVGFTYRTGGSERPPPPAAVAMAMAR